SVPKWRNDFGKDPVDLVTMRKETSAVEIPETDPVYGTEGPLMSLWTDAVEQLLP
ncbi:hypothetical protein ACJ73_04190, partial [Blastomyces percursus]